jgi:Protein of unknown function with PCYCGC motif
MGRKSAAKNQARTTPTAPGTPPPSEPGRPFTPLLAVAIVALLAVVGLFAYSRAGQPEQPVPSAAQSSTAPAQAAVGPPPAAALGPHPQENLPPLPSQAFPPPRSLDVVRAAYRFAAEHPEILSYVPCFCGCERGGHRGNEDCFVKARNTQGDVTQWDEHGLDCAVCLDVANEAMQMYRSGASVRDIRSAIDKKWSSPTSGHTPTPLPPPAATK